VNNALSAFMSADRRLNSLIVSTKRRQDSSQWIWTERVIWRLVSRLRSWQCPPKQTHNKCSFEFKKGDHLHVCNTVQKSQTRLHRSWKSARASHSTWCMKALDWPFLLTILLPKFTEHEVTSNVWEWDPVNDQGWWKISYPATHPHTMPLRPVAPSWMFLVHPWITYQYTLYKFVTDVDT
jgi:hypothetical protein